jgi:hypothetical protein
LNGDAVAGVSAALGIPVRFGPEGEVMVASIQFEALDLVVDLRSMAVYSFNLSLMVCGCVLSFVQGITPFHLSYVTGSNILSMASRGALARF